MDAILVCKMKAEFKFQFYLDPQGHPFPTPRGFKCQVEALRGGPSIIIKNALLVERAELGKEPQGQRGGNMHLAVFAILFSLFSHFGDFCSCLQYFPSFVRAS